MFLLVTMSVNNLLIYNQGKFTKNNRVSPELKLQNNLSWLCYCPETINAVFYETAFHLRMSRMEENWNRYEILSNSILCKFMYETKSSIAMKSSGL